METPDTAFRKPCPMHLPALSDIPLIVSLGAALGFFGGLFGIGGGIIAIPLLALAFGMDQALAQGTALVMMVPNLLIGWWRYQQRHPVPLSRLLAIAAVAMTSTGMSAHFAARLDSSHLRVLFGIFLCVLALTLLRRRAQADDVPARARFGVRLTPVVGLVGGSSMGLFGVGGGLVSTPLFVRLFGQRQTVAQSLGLALVTPSAVVALGTYAQAQRVDWMTGALLALGGLFTVSAGVSFAHRLPEAKMRALFAWMMLATAAWLVLSGLRN